MSQIIVSTIISAPVSTVWECFTTPVHVQGWNNASADWECPSATNDLRVGGRFCYVMGAKDKSVEFNFSGVFTVVEKEKCLEYTMCEVNTEPMDNDRRVQVSFQSQGENTIVTETFDPENENPEELQKRGWESILNNFKVYVENNSKEFSFTKNVN
jgi:uncharacterized protein YndB with AHSA1/START domain